MRAICLTIVLFTNFLLIAHAQDYDPDLGRPPLYLGPGNGFLVTGTVVNGDTIALIYLREVTVLPAFHFISKKQEERYSRLVYYVKKVYPYSLIIRNTVFSMEEDLRKLRTEREKKMYIDKKEKELRGQFEGQLVKMTVTQGKILIKLVDRQTGRTTYEVVKQLKGSISAFFWQSIARVFGSNLKSEYDAKGDDAMIEDIIIRIENGQL